MVDLFMREARIMSTLRHPAIVSVLDFAQDGDMHVMVLDYIHGFHLGRWQKFIAKTRGRFPVEIAIHVMLQVVRALGYAHTLKAPDGQPLNIVHRDVTPSNILVDVEGHTKLADFGIARMNTDKTEVGKTQIKGKLPYLAPEVIEGGQPSAASDVYSVGVTLHELLLGRNEFKAPNMAAVIARVMQHVPTRVADIRDDVSPELSNVIAHAMAKKRDDRYKSAAELADALSRVRSWTEDEGARKVAEMAGEDFRDPRMSEVLAVPPLDDLESSWNTPTPMSISQVHAATSPNDPLPDDDDEDSWVDSDPNADLAVYQQQSSPHDVKTQALSPRMSAQIRHAAFPESVPPPFPQPPRETVTPAPQPPAPAPAPTPAPAPVEPKRFPWAMALMGVGILAVGAIGVIALLRSGDRDPPADEGGVVVIDKRAAADAAIAIDAAPAGDAAAVPIDAGGKKPPKDAGPAPKRDPARELTRAFEKQKGKVAACFEAHTTDATDLAVRFQVDTDGKVAVAELVPASLASTPLGKCLLDVARATKFPELEKSMTFRVPLTARMK